MRQHNLFNLLYNSIQIMSKSVKNSKPVQRFNERQFMADWGGGAKQSRGAKKVMRNQVRAKENQMLRNGKFNMDTE